MKDSPTRAWIRPACAVGLAACLVGLPSCDDGDDLGPVAPAPPCVETEKGTFRCGPSDHSEWVIRTMAEYEAFLGDCPLFQRGESPPPPPGPGEMLVAAASGPSPCMEVICVSGHADPVVVDLEVGRIGVITGFYSAGAWALAPDRAGPVRFEWVLVDCP